MGVVNLELINRKFNKGTAVKKVCEVSEHSGQ